MERKNDILVYQLTKFHPEVISEMDYHELRMDTLLEPNPIFASLEEAQVASFSIMDEIMEWQARYFGEGKGGWSAESKDGTELFIHEMEITW